MAKKKINTKEDLETQLWKAADKLKKNIDAAEYKHIVLGLIFLKYISDAFEELCDQLKAGEGEYAGLYNAEHCHGHPFGGFSICGEWLCYILNFHFITSRNQKGSKTGLRIMDEPSRDVMSVSRMPSGHLDSLWSLVIKIARKNIDL